MRLGRPPKAPKDRRDEDVKISLTVAEKKAIWQAAHAADTRPITWCRAMLMRAAAKRKATKK
jgi:hypothetical protein